jgi:hypothetical protein
MTGFDCRASGWDTLMGPIDVSVELCVSQYL